MAARSFRKVGARADLLSDTSITQLEDTTYTPVHSESQSPARVSPQVEIMEPRRKGSPRCGTFLSQATPESLTAGTLEQTELEAAKATRPPHKSDRDRDAAARKHLPAIAGWDKVCYSRPTSVCSSSEQRWPESMRLLESLGRRSRDRDHDTEAACFGASPHSDKSAGTVRRQSEAAVSRAATTSVVT
jgi:hypothetical protein